MLMLMWMLGCAVTCVGIQRSQHYCCSVVSTPFTEGGVYVQRNDAVRQEKEPDHA